MRLRGALVVGIIMYIAVPMLWQRAVLAEVNRVTANSAGMPVVQPLEINQAMRQIQTAQDQAWAASHPQMH